MIKNVFLEIGNIGEISTIGEVAEVKKRISLIDVDSILESAYIEEMIED